MSARARALLKRVAILGLRHAPGSWRLKRGLLWFVLPRFALGVHAVVRDGDGNVLLLHSSYSPEWQLPGGGVDYGETFDQAMRRELREETGMAPRALRYAGMFMDRSGRGLHVVFAVVLPAEPPRLSLEHNAWRYAPAQELRGVFRACVAIAEAPESS